jgi:hypothetical protein
MGFTTKVANVVKGAIANTVSGFQSGANNQVQKKKVAAKLLNKSPLELESPSPTSHMKENPYNYGTAYYPQETSNLGDGHYVIFDVIMHKASKFKSKQFGEQGIIGVSDHLVGEKSLIKRADKVKTASDKGVGAETRVKAVNSGLNEKTPTHTYISDSMILYTPGEALKFNYSVGYNDMETGLAGLIGQGISNIGESESFLEGLKTTADLTGDAGAILLRKAAFGAASLIPGFENIEGAFDKAKGQAVNPQMELVFQGVPFREFTFPFTFAPKNYFEKEEMYKIINLFKFHMHPEFKDSNRSYFLVPSEFQITYMYRENRNAYIPRISRCVLTGMNVNFAPQDVISTFKQDTQGTPATMATMSLTFKETEIMTKERIADGY